MAGERMVDIEAGITTAAAEVGAEVSDIHHTVDEAAVATTTTEAAEVEGEEEVVGMGTINLLTM